MPTNDLLAEIASRHAVYLEGLKTGYANEFDRFLRAMQRDIVAQIAAVEDMESLKGRRLNALLRAVRKTLDTGFGDYETVWREQLAELGAYEAEFEVKGLKKTVDADFTLPAPAQIMDAAFARPLSVTGIDEGKLLEPFFRDWTGKTYERVEGAIRLGAAQGQTTQQVIRRIRGTRARKYQDGLIAITKREVDMMTRTALQHMANSAKTTTWDANKDIIEAMEWLSVLDGRTSLLCRSLSGREFPIGKGPQPPAHMNCRSTLIPVLRKGLSLLGKSGKQFSRGEDGVKRVNADLTYHEWLKTQSAEFQDSVLGETRGKLLRNGGLTAKRFSELQLDKKFQPRTLDEIRALEPLAFERAGI